MSSQRPTRAPAPGAEYDSFADIYEIWTDSAAATSANRPFYLDAHLATDGPVVELGVGDGWHGGRQADGDFQSTSFEVTSASEQVWIARKPG